jgi:thymidylate synthase
MLWIYQAQSNDIRWLQERNVHIWDLWEINENGDWCDEKTGAVLKHFDPAYAHTIGTAYGYIVRRFQLIDRLIDSLQNHPEDRRRVMSLWQDDYLDTAVLPSCVWSSEWDITEGKLNAWVHQRSCDVPLGLPFNVTQYAVLLRMLAQVTGLQPGTLSWSIKDAHIYVNQIDGIKEQLERYHTQGDLPAPKLWLNPDIKDFYAFDNSTDLKDIKLENYQHMGKIRFPLAQ